MMALFVPGKRMTCVVPALAIAARRRRFRCTPPAAYITATLEASRQPTPAKREIKSVLLKGIDLC